MRALVVFESMYGNTQAVARAVAEGLSARGGLSGFEVEVVDVAAAPAAVDEQVCLLVVGGPTHAFGLSRPQTRADAARQGPARPGSTERGIREWIEGLHPGSVAAATFDTRIDKPRVPGSAARGARRRLRRLGFRADAAARSFYVTGTQGPLADGEIERARQWGEQLASTITVEADNRQPG